MRSVMNSLSWMKVGGSAVLLTCVSHSRKVLKSSLREIIGTRRSSQWLVGLLSYSKAEIALVVVLSRDCN